MNEALDSLAREGYVNERGETAPLRDLSDELPGVRFRIEDQVRAGSLLVAHPTWQTPSFHQSVAYVCQHAGEAGDVTLILNRPLHASLRHLLSTRPSAEGSFDEEASESGSDPLGDLAPLADEPVHYGGNTSVRQLLALHRVPTVGSVLPGCKGLRLTAALDAVAGEVAAGYAHSSDALLFSGFTFWGPGELAKGVQEGRWILSSAFDCNSDGAEPLPLLPSFTHSARERLWAIALTRLGGEYAHFTALEGFQGDVEHEVECPF